MMARATATSAAAILAVLYRASQDGDFLGRLLEGPDEALLDYPLEDEEKAAIARGDIEELEAYVGELDERLRSWLLERQYQERW